MLGHKVLVEPFIKNWEKFNSNTGWANNDNPWPMVMQAISHFSYHITNGHMVLCDLQGGCYSDGVILTDPVILSNTRSFGVTDLGPKGISSFFSQHVCNSYCRPTWLKPQDKQKYFAPVKCTTMTLPWAPTQQTGVTATKPRLASVVTQAKVNPMPINC